MRMRRLILPVLVAGLALSGCGPRVRHAPEPPPPPGVVAAPPGIKFSVKIKPTRFALGEHVFLEATLFNDNTRNFEQTFATSCTWDYEVTAEDGRVVGPIHPCDSMAETLRLEPGELRMIMRDWQGRDRYFDAMEALLPGTYKVTAGFVDENRRVVPMADPVTVVITKR